jgi:fluoride exporter
MSHQDRPGLQSAYLAVALGSALGGVLRWWLSELLQAPPGQGFPWGTLWVNVSGSLLIGWYAARVAAAHGRRSKLGQLFFMTGFCGGYTTFSIFSLETLLLLQAGHHGLAGGYVVTSLLLWLGGVWAGWRLGSQGRWGAAR